MPTPEAAAAVRSSWPAYNIQDMCDPPVGIRTSLSLQPIAYPRLHFCVNPHKDRGVLFSKTESQTALNTAMLAAATRLPAPTKVDFY